MFTAFMDIRVEWGHCDPAGIVYNPNFYDWMEHGLRFLFDAAGVDFQRLHLEDPEFRGMPLVNNTTRFVSPARLGDTISMRSTISRFGSRSFDTGFTFMCAENLVAEGVQTRVWGRAAADDPQRLRAVAVPDWVRAALSAPREARWESKTVIR